MLSPLLTVFAHSGWLQPSPSPTSIFRARPPPAHHLALPPPPATTQHCRQVSRAAPAPTPRLPRVPCASLQRPHPPEPGRSPPGPSGARPRPQAPDQAAPLLPLDQGIESAAAASQPCRPLPTPSPEPPLRAVASSLPGPRRPSSSARCRLASPSPGTGPSRPDPPGSGRHHNPHGLLQPASPEPLVPPPPCFASASGKVGDELPCRGPRPAHPRQPQRLKAQLARPSGPLCCLLVPVMLRS
ncbi:predicted GPI-anchored protein 58 [Triticum aestivum]|uniref:predicted GPI-anchored protein 58 n=1 Tax=Triticum aestivum TaxID=4565 RepID=UPI001D034704|nr:predicted GPI-anchored protein 58 [Triticum aestivum]